MAHYGLLEMMAKCQEALVIHAGSQALREATDGRSRAVLISGGQCGRRDSGLELDVSKATRRRYSKMPGTPSVRVGRKKI
ncbi:hypothetical protein AO259_00700 [Pseudomonas sp. ICMP 564]|nr:hypothetical protein AO259_00700 [Pseudomonas sp. ICMP 564]